MDKITPKTSFGQWFSPINLQLFEENVKTMKLDHYTKKLTTDSFLKLLLYSQLSRRLNTINPEIFQQLFLDLVVQIHRKTNHSKITMPLKIIDSSTLPLNLTNHKCA